jgi:hypothetical protein
MAETIAKHSALPEAERPCCSGDTTLVIKDLDGSKRWVWLSLDVTTRALKQCMALRNGVVPDQTRVIRRGLALCDDVSLRRQCVRAGDVLHLIMQMRGS